MAGGDELGGADQISAPGRMGAAEPLEAPGIYFVEAAKLRPLDVLDEGLRIRSVRWYWEPRTSKSSGRVTVEAGHDAVVEEDLGENVTIRNESTGAEFPAKDVTLRRIEWSDLREIAFSGDEKVRIARGVPPGVGSGFLGSPWRSGPDEGLADLRPSSAEDELLQ